LKLEAALDEFGLDQRRRVRGDEGRQVALAIATLREYLMDAAGLLETGDLSSDDLFDFLLDYYPSQEEPDPAVLTALLEAASGFALWLLDRGETALAPFADAGERLREDLPRVTEALLLLQEHLREAAIAEPTILTDESSGVELGAIGSGADRLARLDELDYARAETDHYRIGSLDERGLTLLSDTRKLLGDGAAGPVAVPAEVAELLRPGDILYAEIAPGPGGWELLEVFGIRPGGYA
jgi:hypothetical protein